MTSGLKKSIALHLAFLVLWFVEVPMFWWNRPDPSQVPIIVDLKDVKISEMTNLPPKAKIGKEDKEAGLHCQGKYCNSCRRGKDQESAVGAGQDLL